MLTRTDSNRRASSAHFHTCSTAHGHPDTCRVTLPRDVDPGRHVNFRSPLSEQGFSCPFLALVSALVSLGPLELGLQLDLQRPTRLAFWPRKQVHLEAGVEEPAVAVRQLVVPSPLASMGCSVPLPNTPHPCDFQHSIPYFVAFMFAFSPFFLWLYCIRQGIVGQGSSLCYVHTF